MLLYILTIFLSAFLIFQVQPLIAKFILPWFGGSPAVWTTSLLFFQTFLLAGYVYAHVIIRRLKIKFQVIVHLILLLVGLTQLPIIPAETWQPDATSAPAWHILLLLTASLGLPYFILSSSAPLIQAWFSRVFVGRSPYRLYALSNVGSLLGLLTYPFLFEPLTTRNLQAVLWSIGFGLYAILCAVTLIMTWRRSQTSTPTPTDPSETETARPAPTPGLRALWLMLSGTAVVLLLSFTNQLTQDIAPIPFLWVVPLSLYLLTFIIAFDHDRWYRRSLVVGTVFLSVVGTAVVLTLFPTLSLLVQLGAYNVALFLLCLFCHGELARLRPAPEHLTGYFLSIALGGALGGVFVGLVAPAIFNDYYEPFLGLLSVIILACIIAILRDRALFPRRRWKQIWVVQGGLALGAVIWALGFQILQDRETTLARTRNFYGTLKVLESHGGQAQEQRWLISGAITHGVQYTAPERSRWPITYFSEASGIGQALNAYSDKPRRIGILGLGAGTLASYGQPGDVIRIYEINPEVEDYAQTYFTYLRDSEAEVDIVIGDGRLSLEQEEPQNFDILVMDAFSGDSIPVHLLTEEAFAIYLDHLAPGGTLAIQISNLHLDLAPVVLAVAERYDLQATHIINKSDPERTIFVADWMLLTQNDEVVALLGSETQTSDSDVLSVRLWTDDYTSLFPILR